ncbi:MAG: arabinogalactan oligomer / maltooligosaccharide transport system substrate-binding protein [Chloroflexota bacterium]|jgi:arabinogalactan oligomer/maltooligosaccharide transport system substrate-binding protein|nr:arabinogalactan oligomer / maltooligosaccharide transport system substrate-binding protein [Chloroflexota bacterium]
MFLKTRSAPLLAVVLLVAACGGGTATKAPTVVPATGTPAASAPAATSTPAASAPAPTETAAAPTETAAAPTETAAAPTDAPVVTPAPTPSANCVETAASDPAPADIPTGLSGSLTVWEAYGASGSAERDAFCTMVANVKAANPDLTVDVLDYPFGALFSTFELQAASGGGPDLFIAPNDSLPSEARAALLKDMTPLIDQLKAAPYNISDTALTADTVDGKLFAIPESMKAVATFYRKDIFPKAPATTDEWMANASKLGWVYGANGGGAYYNWGLYGAFGGKILADDGKCAAAATTGVADALKWLQDMKAAGMKFYQGDNDAKTDFIAGTIGAFIDGPWQSGDLKTALGDKLAVAPGPSGPNGDAFQPMAAPDGYYINDSSQNPDLAMNFALAMLTPANEQIFVDKAGHIPANTTMTISDPIAAGFQTAIETGFARPTAKELNNYWGNFGDAIVKAVDAGTDPTTLVADACAKMDQANAGS